MANGPILIISGTNRPNSNALKVARVLEAHYARAGAMVDLLNLEHLPKELFDPSIYTTKPAAMGELQARVLAAAGWPRGVFPFHAGEKCGPIKTGRSFCVGMIPRAGAGILVIEMSQTP